MFTHHLHAQTGRRKRLAAQRDGDPAGPGSGSPPSSQVWCPHPRVRGKSSECHSPPIFGPAAKPNTLYSTHQHPSRRTRTWRHKQEMGEGKSAIPEKSTRGLFSSSRPWCCLCYCVISGGRACLLVRSNNVWTCTYPGNGSLGSLGFNLANPKPQWHNCSAC